MAILLGRMLSHQSRAAITPKEQLQDHLQLLMPETALRTTPIKVRANKKKSILIHYQFLCGGFYKGSGKGSAEKSTSGKRIISVEKTDGRKELYTTSGKRRRDEQKGGDNNKRNKSRSPPQRIGRSPPFHPRLGRSRSPRMRSRSPRMRRRSSPRYNTVT